ncbi:uncharacterized protein LOC132703699 isoform X2 [Cylas formicarius]|uniref:uncharacterized protein LOC132703699 isoform X2 n=1 Tax=Cylas formicarius TaxID=197179 RepID=UPI00295885AC|nr:uncharacterized protein LOC132703699 isoform X2 [Cylas formicarius]
MLKSPYIFIFVIASIKGEKFYRPQYFLEDEVRHVRDTRESSKKPQCDDNVLVTYLADFQITNPESIVGIAINDFDSACRTIENNLRRVDRYLKNCSLPVGLYLNLIYGLRSMDEKLCKNLKFYRKFDTFYACFHDLNRDYDSCDGPADWNEDEDKNRVCKQYKSITDCYFVKTAKVCGISAAKTLKEIMVDTIDCVLTVKCNVKSNPTVRDAMPEKYMKQLTKNTCRLSKCGNPNNDQI